MSPYKRKRARWPAALAAALVSLCLLQVVAASFLPAGIAA